MMIRIGMITSRRTASSILAHMLSTLGGGSGSVGGGTYRAVASKNHIAACSYSVTTSVSKGVDDDGVNSVGGTTIMSDDSTATMSIDAAATDLKNKYRSVLKYVKTLPSSHNWLKYIKEKVHLDKFESDEDRKRHLSSIVMQYSHMISSLNELKHLRGLDSGEKLDPRDKIRHTAARVGLSVPKFADEFDRAKD